MQNTKLTNEQIDAELAHVLEVQVSFKNRNMLAIACGVVQAALEKNGSGIWPDDESVLKVTANVAGDDKNCIGTAWRLLLRVGLLSRTGDRRRSTAASSKGREIARWTCSNRRLCETFLSRNKWVFEKDQKELAL